MRSPVARSTSIPQEMAVFAALTASGPYKEFLHEFYFSLIKSLYKSKRK